MSQIPSGNNSLDNTSSSDSFIGMYTIQRNRISLQVQDGAEVCFTLFTSEAVGNAHGIVLLSGYSLVTLMVLVTNVALIYGLYKTNGSLTLAQRLFVLMSAMDMVIGVVFIPLSIFNIVQALSASGHQSCLLITIQAFVSMFFPFLSGLVLLLVVIHRFLLVINTPFTRKLAERRYIRACLMSFVIFSATMSVWYVFLKKEKSVTYHGTYYLTAGVITSGFIFMITSINLKLLHFLKKAKKRLPGATITNNNINNKSTMSVKKNLSRGTYHKRVSKTLAILSVVVAVCYTPMAVSFLISGIFLLNQSHEKIAIIQIIIPWSQLVMTLNSALNSYFYIVRTKSMSKFYKQRLGKLFHCNNKSCNDGNDDSIRVGGSIGNKIRSVKRSAIGTVHVTPHESSQSQQLQDDKKQMEIYSQFGSERL